MVDENAVGCVEHVFAPRGEELALLVENDQWVLAPAEHVYPVAGVHRDAAHLDERPPVGQLLPPLQYFVFEPVYAWCHRSLRLTFHPSPSLGLAQITQSQPGKAELSRATCSTIVPVMFPNLVPDRVEMDITLDELIPLAARHGYGGIDLPLPEVAARPDHPQLADATSDAALRWGAFNLPVEFRSDRATYDAGVGRLEAWLPIVQALGCDRCYDSVVPGHDTLDYSANFEHHVARLKPIAEILADHGIRLGLEFTGPKTLRETFRYPFIHTIAQVLDLCEAISPTPGNGEVGVLLDSYHWWTSRASERDIIELLGHDRDRVRRRQ